MVESKPFPRPVDEIAIFSDGVVTISSTGNCTKEVEIHPQSPEGRMLGFLAYIVPSLPRVPSNQLYADTLVSLGHKLEYNPRNPRIILTTQRGRGVGYFINAKKVELIGVADDTLEGCMLNATLKQNDLKPRFLPKENRELPLREPVDLTVTDILMDVFLKGHRIYWDKLQNELRCTATVDRNVYNDLHVKTINADELKSKLSTVLLSLFAESFNHQAMDSWTDGEAMIWQKVLDLEKKNHMGDITSLLKSLISKLCYSEADFFTTHPSYSGLNQGRDQIRIG